MSLGLASDHRLATASATFRLGVAPYGLSPVLMATTVLPCFAGQRVATEMYVNDLSMDALYMTASGLVDDILVDS